MASRLSLGSSATSILGKASASVSMVACQMALVVETFLRSVSIDLDPSFSKGAFLERSGASKTVSSAFGGTVSCAAVSSDLDS